MVHITHFSAFGAFGNIVAVRKHEMDKGIAVFDKTGETIGTSKKAAEKVYRNAMMRLLKLSIQSSSISGFISNWIDESSDSN